LQELENSLNMSFLQYKQYCEDLDIGDYYNNYGNDKYKRMVDKEHAKFDNDNTHFYDVLILIKYCNETLFCKDKQGVYPELSLAAVIVLGKPTHNAFQERVFSKGTYIDTKLKKRTSEDTFKINLLNACNTHNMTSLNNVITSIKNRHNNKRVKMTLSWRCTQRSKIMRQTG
jgi:hypothetical protein